jgi:prepilin-type N-terminal cleavage/methylation domain-containing protein
MKLLNRCFADERGQSLIEVLTVLVLIGLLAGAAVPSMRGYMAEARVRTALDRMAGDISYARMLALRAGARVELRQTGPAGYTVTIPATGRTLRTVSLATDAPGLHVVMPTSDSALVFTSRGFLVSSGTGRVVARLGAASDTAMLTISGGVYRDH